MNIFHDYISINMWSYVEDGTILCNTILKSGSARDGKTVCIYWSLHNSEAKSRTGKTQDDNSSNTSEKFFNIFWIGHCPMDKDSIFYLRWNSFLISSLSLVAPARALLSPFPVIESTSAWGVASSPRWALQLLTHWRTWTWDSSYGSVSAGREKWPFNVLFF